MPKISEFYGIAIYMFASDHAPPHFHAYYGEFEVLFGISPARILQGKVPRRVQSLIFEWVAMHQQELLKDWDLCASQQKPLPIKPLD